MSLVRVWAAVEIDGVVVCDVRDVERAVIGEGASPEYRPWAYHVVDADSPNPSHDMDRETCACRPGRPCAKANARARNWWPEWQRRTDRRMWRAYRPNPRPNAVAVSDWGDGKHATADLARAEARRLKMPFVVLVDGHHHELERHLVNPAQPSLI